MALWTTQLVQYSHRTSQQRQARVTTLWWDVLCHFLLAHRPVQTSKLGLVLRCAKEVRAKCTVVGVNYIHITYRHKYMHLSSLFTGLKRVDSDEGC